VSTVLVPLPDRDFDVTEVAVPWRVLTRAGHRVVFATEAGARPEADPRLLTGVLFGQLGAEREAVAFYRELEHDVSFALRCAGPTSTRAPTTPCCSPEATRRG
jgi:putative intracellular protease/amidase